MILHLAVADLILLLTLPLSIHETLFGWWSFPDLVCRFHRSVLQFNCYASVLLLAVSRSDALVILTCVKPSRISLIGVRSHEKAFPEGHSCLLRVPNGSPSDVDPIGQYKQK